MRKTCLLVDFEDSFTQNIAQSLSFHFPSVEVIHYKESVSRFLSKRDLFPFVMWGAGPGHVREYSEVYEVIRLLFKNKAAYQTGICLGHQLLCRVLLSCEIKPRVNGPVHGQVKKVSLSGAENSVVFYNSLAVIGKVKKGFSAEKNSNKEILAMKSKNDLTSSVQFHPESVGSDAGDLFFKAWHSDYQRSWRKYADIINK